MDFAINNTICSFTLTPDLFDYFLEKSIYFFDHRRLRAQQGRRFTFLREVKLGSYSSILSGTEIVNVGSYSYSHSPLRHTMSVGNYCSIAGNVQTMGADHPFERFSSGSFTYDSAFPICADSSADLKDRFKPVRNTRADAVKAQISHDVWIGGQVLLANSINIGTGAIVAAGSVVTKNVAPYTIVGGNPARVIRKRFPDEICERLLATDWFSHHFPFFKGVDVSDDLETTIHQLETVIATGKVPQIESHSTVLDLLSEYAGEDLSK